jgi:hypothetical protein
MLLVVNFFINFTNEVMKELCTIFTKVRNIKRAH